MNVSYLFKTKLSGWQLVTGKKLLAIIFFRRAASCQLPVADRFKYFID